MPITNGKRPVVVKSRHGDEFMTFALVTVLPDPPALAKIGPQQWSVSDVVQVFCTDNLGSRLFLTDAKFGIHAVQDSPSALILSCILHLETTVSRWISFDDGNSWARVTPP